MAHLILFKWLLLIARAHGKYTTQKLLGSIHTAKWHQKTMLIIYTTCMINENSLRGFKAWFISSQQDNWKRWGESHFWFLKAGVWMWEEMSGKICAMKVHNLSSFRLRVSVLRLQKGLLTLLCIPGHSLHQIRVVSDSYSVLKAENHSNNWEQSNKVCFLNGIFHCSIELTPSPLPPQNQNSISDSRTSFMLTLLVRKTFLPEHRRSGLDHFLLGWCAIFFIETAELGQSAQIPHKRS